MAPCPPQLRKPPLLGDALAAAGFNLSAPPYPQFAAAFAILQLQLDELFFTGVTASPACIFATVHFSSQSSQTFCLTKQIASSMPAVGGRGDGPPGGGTTRAAGARRSRRQTPIFAFAGCVAKWLRHETPEVPNLRDPAPSGQ
jgi:hypothetical protein